jgi:thiol peroxidase
MAQVTFKGNPIQIKGSLPSVGSKAPDFRLTMQDLKKVGLNDFSGKKKILNIFISLDTPVCSKSMHEFSAKIEGKSNAIVLNISEDLPFAASRFCNTEGLKNTITLSAFHSSFTKDYGVEIGEGALEGLSARAVLVLDTDNKVLYSELVSEITQEPKYEEALKYIE